MKPGFIQQGKTSTPFVELNTRKCQDCQQCIKACRNHVIGRVNLPWHKHALIINPGLCSGCLKCTRVCPCEAIGKFDPEQNGAEKQHKKAIRGFIINNLLLLTGLLMIVSGLTLQLKFHVGQKGSAPTVVHHTASQPDVSVLLLNDRAILPHYRTWSTVHKTTIIFFSLLIIYHTATHLKWYKTIFRKRLIRKNRQTLILTLLFLLVAFSGIVPWLTGVLWNNNNTRLMLIELHDKLALIFLVFLVLHVAGRIKGFIWPLRRTAVRF